MKRDHNGAPQRYRGQAFHEMETVLLLKFDGGDDASRGARIAARRLILHPSFHYMATLDDNYTNAENMLSILMWLDAGIDSSIHDGFWGHMLTYAFDRVLPQWNIRYLETECRGYLQDFVFEEIELTRSLRIPIPTLQERKSEILLNFRTYWPPRWYGTAMRSFDPATYDNLPLHE